MQWPISEISQYAVSVKEPYDNAFPSSLIRSFEVIRKRVTGVASSHNTGRYSRGCDISGLIKSSMGLYKTVKHCTSKKQSKRAKAWTRRHDGRSKESRHVQREYFYQCYK